MLNLSPFAVLLIVRIDYVIKGIWFIQRLTTDKWIHQVKRSDWVSPPPRRTPLPRVEDMFWKGTTSALAIIMVLVIAMVSGVTLGTLCSRAVEFGVCTFFVLVIDRKLCYRPTRLLRQPEKPLLREFSLV